MRPALIKKNVSLKFHSTESVIIEFDHFTGKFDHFFAIKANPIVLSTPLEKKVSNWRVKPPLCEVHRVIEKLYRKMEISKPEIADKIGIE